MTARGLLFACVVLVAACGDDTGGGDSDASDIPDAAPVSPGLVGSWDFREGDGVTIFDTSGVEPLLDLEIFNFNNVSWGEGFLTFKGPTIARTVGPATKIIESLMATSSGTIEMWIRTDTVDQGTATVVSIGQDSGQHNLWAGAQSTRYASRFRLTDADLNGDNLTTAEFVIDTELTHVVHTRDASVRRIYVDGVQSAEELDVPGDFAAWNPEYRLSFGGESNQDVNVVWLGEIHRIAIYDRLLSAQDVFDNFEAGPDSP